MARALAIVLVSTLSAAAAPLSTTCAAPQTRPAGAQTPAAAAPVFDSAKAWEHLRQMVAIGPRPAGSAQLRQTRAYITRQLTSAGLTVQEQPFTATTPLGKIDMVNLIVRLPGRRSDRILFTGHYDTKLFKDQVFVGASDGASSGAFLIELARVLKAQPTREFTYEFVWFDGEEAVVDWTGQDHTYGSRYYVQAAQKAGALTSIKAMVLVDMIGAKSLKIQRDGNSAKWMNDILWSAAKRLNYGHVFADIDTQVEDDHMEFTRVGIPCLDIIDLNDYPQWHNSMGVDDLEHVEAKSLQAVGDVLLAAIPEFERYLAR